MLKEAIDAARGAWEEAKGTILKFSIILNVVYLLVSLLLFLLLLKSCEDSKKSRAENLTLQESIIQKQNDILNLKRETAIREAVLKQRMSLYTNAVKELDIVNSRYPTNSDWRNIARAYQARNN